jgi:hypothetical protein
MSRGFIGIWASFLVLSPVTTANIVDGYSKNSNYNLQEGKRLSSKLYERCLEIDTEACVGYKLFSTALSYFQDTTDSQSDDTADNGTIGQDMEGQVDGILLQKFLELVTPSSMWASRTADAARRESHFSLTSY